jgi:hypothetical protein
MKARRSWYVLTLAAALALGVASGCTRARNDAQIAGDVQGKINSDSNVPAKQITVTSSNGIVTLAGNVGSDMERQAAANDAAQVEGVKTVVNNLQVTPATAQAAPEPEPEPQSPPSREYSRPRRSPKVYRDQSPAPAPASAPASVPAVTPSTPPTTAMAPPTPPPPPKPVTIPDGTVLQIRMIDTIDSATNQPGDRFRATLDAPVTDDHDNVVIPHGADVEGRVAELKGAGHFAGKPQIALELTALNINGRRYSLHTNQYSREGSSRGKNTAEKVGGGAAVGSIIGAIAGGGKGAAIGGIIGAGAGGGVQAATKAPSIHVPSEALLSFTLQSPLTVTPVSSVQRSRSSRSSSDYGDSQNQPQQRSDNVADYSDSQNQSTSDTDANPPVLKRR